jgi:hypothetical protein
VAAIETEARNSAVAYVATAAPGCRAEHSFGKLSPAAPQKRISPPENLSIITLIAEGLWSGVGAKQSGLKANLNPWGHTLQKNP